MPLAPTARPFVLLEPALLRGLLEDVEALAGKLRSRAYTPALLAAASGHLESGDIAVFCDDAGANQLRGLLGMERPPRAAKSDVLASAERFAAIAGLSAGLAERNSVALAFVGSAQDVSPDGDAAMRFSAGRRLPVIWITQTPAERSSAVPVEGLRPRLPRIATDGEDAVALYRVLQETIRQARTGGGPTWLDAQTGAPETDSGAGRAVATTRSRDLSVVKMRRYLETRRLLSGPKWHRRREGGGFRILVL